MGDILGGYMLIILPPKRLKQKEYTFEVYWGYKVRPCLKNNKKKNEG